jgi:hypothetical protein
MKLRVAMTPPVRGAETRIIFGTDCAPTSPSDISGPACRRIDSSRAFSTSSASSASRVSSPRSHMASVSRITQGMPLSIGVQATPSIMSTARPLGSSAPHIAPASPSKTNGTGAAPPGTPSSRAAPS